MAVPPRDAVSPRVVVDTNVFELCELKSLAWRAFRCDAGDGNGRTAAASSAQEAFAAFARGAAQPAAALTAWRDDALWVFSVNHAQKLPDAGAGVHVAAHGEWASGSVDDAAPTDAAALPLVFRALRAWLARHLVASGAFRAAKTDDGLLTLNEARFVFRRPSLARAQHFDVFLDEAVAAAGLALHVHLLTRPAHRLLCVNVEMLRPCGHGGGAATDFRSAWQRLLGLPRGGDHCVVDVWHADALLAARVVAETAHGDVVPRFRAVPRRRLKRRNAFGDAGGDDDDATKGKPDDHDDDRDDGNDTGNDGDGDDGARRNGGGLLLGKRRRKKPASDAAENDESIIPASPDTHVNSPDAGGPVVRMTFPHEHALALQTDSDVHMFKRRRRRKKDSKSSQTSLLSFAPLAGSRAGTPTLTPALTMSTTTVPLLGSRSRSGGSTTPSLLHKGGEPTKPPSLSLAVSLVASLTQDEQQEALDTKPVKTHPLLEALDAYVDNEMAAHRACSEATTRLDHVRAVPNAPAFSPSLDDKKKTQLARLAATASVNYEQLKGQLLSERFKRYLAGDFPRDFRRNKQQQRRERERKILLEYDEAKLLQYAASAVAVAMSASSPSAQHSVRDQEIVMGVHLATLDALVPWRLNGMASQRWTPYASGLRAADELDTLTLASHLTPHLTQLQGVVTSKASETAADDEAGEVRDPWMTLERFCAKTSGVAVSSTEMQSKPLTSVPRLCVSTVESSLHVELPAISEYTLRNFQPVAAPKPVDYAVVCPHSPAQWLGTLTLSYLSMFRSAYAQASLGDQAPLDLSGVSGNASVAVDAANATLLVECATESGDAFATYRAAGELLRPLLSQGAKRKQAFSRSAVANVVYVVAPFRRSDAKHKLWLLGAFGRGLFGDEIPVLDDEWAKSVTLELVYLEDLVDVSVDTNPHALLPAAMALYDRVFEQVSLKPLADGAAAAVGKTRHVCERLYHLADPAASSETPAAVVVHAGYAISSDRKWLVTAFTDSLGSILETRVFAIVDDQVAIAALRFLEAACDFVALLGEKAVLAVVQLSSSLSGESTGLWKEVTTLDAFQQLTRRFESLVAKLFVCQAAFMAKELAQVRPSMSSVALFSEEEGVLVVRPDDAASLRERSRVANAKWLRSMQCAPQESAVLRVQHVQSVALSDSDSPEPGETPQSDLELLLTEMASLSYLTTHPIMLERQSPLPLHLAAVDELHSQLERLAFQLTTDPLALRR